MRISTFRIIQEFTNDDDDINKIVNGNLRTTETITRLTIFSNEIEFYEEFIDDRFVNKDDKTLIGFKSGTEIIILANYDNFDFAMNKIHHNEMSLFNKVKLN